MTEMHDDAVPRDDLPQTVRGTSVQGENCLRFQTGAGPATVRVWRPSQTRGRAPAIDVRHGNSRQEHACSPLRADCLLTVFELFADTRAVTRAEHVTTPAAQRLFDLMVALMTRPDELDASIEAATVDFWLAAARPAWWKCCSEETPHDEYANAPEMLRHAVSAWRRAVWLDPELAVEPRDELEVHDPRFECGARMRVIGRLGQKKVHGREARRLPRLVREVEEQYPADECPPLVVGKIGGELAVVPARNLRYGSAPGNSLEGVQS